MEYLAKEKNQRSKHLWDFADEASGNTTKNSHKTH